MAHTEGPASGAPKQMRQGVKAHPFLRPALEFGRTYVAKYASIRIAAAINKGKDAFQAANNFLIAAADAIRVVAQGKAPKDTGNLRGDINVLQRGELRWTVGTNVHYAIYQEFGTGIYGPLGRAYEVPPRMKLPPGLKRGGKSGGRHSTGA